MADPHTAFAQLHRDVTACDRCPRLAGHRWAVGPRRAYAGQAYWNRPVPGFGDPAAKTEFARLATVPRVPPTPA